MIYRVVYWRKKVIVKDVEKKSSHEKRHGTFFCPDGSLIILYNNPQFTNVYFMFYWAIKWDKLWTLQFTSTKHRTGAGCDSLIKRVNFSLFVLIRHGNGTSQIHINSKPILSVYCVRIAKIGKIKNTYTRLCPNCGQSAGCWTIPPQCNAKSKWRIYSEP